MSPQGSRLGGGFVARAFRDGRATAVEARSGRVFQRHSHDEFGIGVITEGAQRSWSGRGAVEAKRGNLITVNPGEVHDGAPVGAQRAWSMLYLAPGFLGALAADLREGGGAVPELEAPVIDDARLSLRFVAARAALNEAGSAFEAHMVVLLAGLLRVVPRSPAPEPDRMKRVRQRIDDEPAGSHALSDLASLAGLSRFQVLRGFVRMTGLPPHAYAVQRRLDVARHLIRGGTALADAAITAGFADQSHLHRAFVARYGLTPGRYAVAFGA